MNHSASMREGRVLRLDLSSGATHEEALPGEVMRAYLGGRGLGAYLLLARRGYEVDPLSPANPLIFAPGPLTGTGAPASGRYSVSARSPLTGTILDGNSGGHWGTVLKRMGYDCLIVEGACAQHSYVVVELRDGRAHAETRAAGGLWGSDVPTSLARLRELHPGSEAAVIGPAGERGVLFASIVNNRGRSIGRGGLGTVMGSKNLKALVLLSDDLPKTPVVDEERFAFINYEANKVLKSNPITSQALPEFGTSVLVNVLNQAGSLPTRNFREGQFEHAEAISGEALRKGFTKRRGACQGCPIGCARRTATASASGEGPEYETIWSLGADCGVGDLSAILEANYLCNQAGMDTITMGSTIACAMELTELDALPDGPRWGDGAAVIELVRATAVGSGLGAELGRGSRRLAAAHGYPGLAMQVKGLEMPGYDPRGMKGQGLAYATSNRGGCHLRANMLNPEILGVPKMIDRFATRGKAGLLINMQNLNAVLDSLVLCKFTAFAMKEDYYARLLSALWGEPVEPQELLHIGERIWTVERLFNLAAGFTRDDDTLPPRLLGEPVPAGPAKGHVVDLPPMLDEYYVCRGWDNAGVPSARKLEQLGLSEVVQAVSARSEPVSARSESVSAPSAQAAGSAAVTQADSAVDLTANRVASADHSGAV